MSQIITPQQDMLQVSAVQAQIAMLSLGIAETVTKSGASYHNIFNALSQATLTLFVNYIKERGQEVTRETLETNLLAFFKVMRKQSNFILDPNTLAQLNEPVQDDQGAPAV